VALLDNQIKYSTSEKSVKRPASEVAVALDSNGTIGTKGQNHMLSKTEAKSAAGCVEKSVLEIFCPYCSSENFVKRGTRKKKNETVQLYLCNDCRRAFTPGTVKGKHYPLPAILDAISLYNIGHSLEKAAQIASRILARNKEEEGQGTEGLAVKDRGKIGSGTLSNWINQFASILPYLRMRPYALKMFRPEDTIISATLAHRQLYRFRYHQPKIRLIMEDDYKNRAFWPLKEFLDLVPAECPHQYFQDGMRASEAPIRFSKTEMIVRSKENYATKLAKLVLGSVKENKNRHDALQRFMLANDSVTVATEVPVYITREDLSHMQTQLGFQLYKNTKLQRNGNKTPNIKHQKMQNTKEMGNKTSNIKHQIITKHQIRERWNYWQKMKFLN